jgi:hypothetical protein
MSGNALRQTINVSAVGVLPRFSDVFVILLLFIDLFLFTAISPVSFASGGRNPQAFSARPFEC